VEEDGSAVKLPWDRILGAIGAASGIDRSSGRHARSSSQVDRSA